MRKHQSNLAQVAIVDVGPPIASSYSTTVDGGNVPETTSRVCSLISKSMVICGCREGEDSFISVASVGF